ncbi:MAG: TIGR00375 family protein [Methanocellales archaeon]
MEVNADLHIHSKYSAATSSDMSLTAIARGSKKKGIHLVGTGDCLHRKWLREIKELEAIDEGTFLLDQTHFILTVEVEDSSRVHHLLFIPSLSKAEELREKFERFSSDIDLQGRPRINLTAVEIAEIAREAQALIGPCHAFTPYTAMYAYFDSLKACYKELASYITFIELGLSADSDYADRIEELQQLTFLTNSDAHSPSPVRLAREFNRFQVSGLTFQEIANAILRKKGMIKLNIGIPPEEGKYNESACARCYRHYNLEECRSKKWRCDCGGSIKKGVKDRVNELANYPEPRHPIHRPPYIRLIPLAEIIALAFNSTVQGNKVQEEWMNLVERFGNEVAVLLDVDISNIAKIAHPKVVKAIKAFREQRIIIHPGGGGRYGRIELNRSQVLNRFQIPLSSDLKQMSLLEFER